MSTEGSRGDTKGLDSSADGQTLVLQATSGDALVIPWDAWLLQAEFAREGSDLILTGADGRQVLVRDYFQLADPPDLATEFGALIKAELAARLAGPLAPGQYAQAGPAAGAAEPIGRVDTIKGSVEATRADGTKVTLNQGDPVYEGDVLATGDGAAVGLVFLDESTFSLAGNGRMTLDELVYDAEAQEGSAAISVVQGVFSFISGQIAKTGPDAMVLTTPVATIGIRGTTVAGTAAAEGQENSITLIPDPSGEVGQIVISNSQGTVEISTAGDTVVLSSFNQAPPPPVNLSPEEIQARYSQALDNLPPPGGSEFAGEPPDQGDTPGPTSVGEIQQAINDAIDQGIQQQQFFQQQIQVAEEQVLKGSPDPTVNCDFSEGAETHDDA